MGTHHKGSQKEIRALNTFIKLVRASESIVARSAPIMADAKLTLSQFDALEALYHLGPLCQKALGEKMLKTGGNVTMVVDNLEKRGLAKRVRNEEDRRYITVHITRKGKNIIGKLFPKVAAQIVEEMSALTAGEQEQLGEMLKRIGVGKGGGA